jgi:hypothetical protein
VIYELRHYVPAPGKAEALSRRFRDSTLALFRRLDFKVVDFWEAADGGEELWYVMEWPSEAAMKAAWDAFRGNLEWVATKKVTEADGPLVQKLQSYPMRRVGYFKP